MTNFLQGVFVCVCYPPHFFSTPFVYSPTLVFWCTTRLVILTPSDEASAASGAVLFLLPFQPRWSSFLDVASPIVEITFPTVFCQLNVTGLHAFACCPDQGVDFPH
ncbi:hypothetical protein CSKR_201325 [Clonorchis sinensis]|uniref:Uncharacterized protein n=1 Tax=Clonorchis sinensis TaxID=79923 RepID=A0A8T1MNM4_CLOSI|nr:hypothetical protein CSKR_201325 [Clonorchis sinensis]